MTRGFMCYPDPERGENFYAMICENCVEAGMAPEGVELTPLSGNSIWCEVCEVRASDFDDEGEGDEQG